MSSGSRPALARLPAPFSDPGPTRFSSRQRTPIPSRSSSRTKSSPSARPGKERRYSWDYDPEMDIYAYSEKTGAMKRLTTARGYDAEGSYSPDGQWIVFTSMRDAYNRTLERRGKEDARGEPELLRRDLHHARRRIGPEAADQRAGLRRRPLLHARRLAHRLAPVRRAGDCSPTSTR